MEPPPEEFYPQQQRQHPWEGSHQRQQHDDDEREGNEFSRQQSSSSRGRSSNRYQTTASSGSKLNTHQVASRPSSHSTSNTPRRKGNPQSCSPSMASKSRSPNKYNNKNLNDRNNISSYSSTSNNSIDGSLPSTTTSTQLTPLSTLSTILTTHASHSHTSLQLYRQSHALHRHATERKMAAIEKLRLAQAELEHATTAQEYAAEELSQSTIQKNEAQVALNSICKQIRHQSKPFINSRVKLVGLNKNAMWNGRLGSIVKLVTDGSSEDVGRWKVKLDPEWRGRDADGKRLARCDTVSLDNTQDCTSPPKNNSNNENGQQGGEEGTTASNMNVVVAKAENLELIDNVQQHDERGDNEMFGSNVLQQQRRSSQQKQQRKSRDPSIQRRSTNDPVAEVTPESTPVKYYKSESDGRYHERKKSESKDRQSVHPKHQQRRNNTRSSSSSKQRQGTRQVSPSKKSQRPWQQQQQQQQSSPYANNKTKKNSSSARQYVTPIRRCPSNDSARLSSAFSQMLLSPVSFASVSFQPEPSDSFQRWVENDDNEKYHPQQYDERGYGRQQQQQQQYIASAGSFFDEVTSLEKDDFGEDDNAYNHDCNYNDNEWVSEEEEGDDPQLYYNPSTPADINTTNTMNEQERLPNIVVLPVPEDDTDSNPFLSPGYTSSSPPHCVGVQNAGVSHVNGVYLLAYPKDDQNNNGGPNNNNTPPLYFRDGPPILLSDNRYYDMCILRIPCPDSAEHVIWFLARVDVDPNCLDVKFSDCYYYCRMLRNDDGMGGERDDGCHVPPSRGWNVPKIPPGVEMLSIGGSRSGSFSTSPSLGHHGGLGIEPRLPTSVRVSGEENDDGEVISEFISPGMDSSKMSSKYSI